MQRLTLATAFLLLAAAPGLANEISFESIGGGVGGFGQPAGEYVARSRAEFDQQGLERYLTQQQLDDVDWADDMVIAVFMGPQSTGGHQISVTGIERRQLMQILPVPGPPPAYEIAVNVMRASPGPGDIVTMAFTAPYQIVKLASSSDHVSFYDVPSRLDFSSFERSIGGFGFSRSIRVDKDGAVVIHTGQPGFGGPAKINRGTANAGQLDRLRRALAMADFPSMPSNMGIPAGTPIPMDAPTSSYLLDVSGQQHRVSGFRPHASDAIKARLATIDRELDVIADEVMPSFESVNLSTTKTVPNDFLTVSVSVSNTGDVTLQQHYAFKEIHFMPLNGRAPQNLIDDLDTAIRLARVESMPADMTPVGALHVQNSFTLDVASVSFPYTGLVKGDMDNLPTQYRFRLQTVFDAMAAIRDHVAQNSGRDEFKGTVQVNGNTVTLEGPHTSVEVVDAKLAALVRNWEGRTVKLEGELSPAGPNQSEIRDAVVIYPQHMPNLVAPVVVDAAGDPTLVYGFGAAAGKVPTFGAAARALELGDGRTVTVDAYAFLDANDRPDEYFVASVQARVTRFSWQTRRGVITGFLRRDDVVQIDRLSRTGRYARTDDGETQGYVRVNRLRVGDDTLTIQPTSAPSGPGLAGSLPGAGN